MNIWDLSSEMRLTQQSEQNILSGIKFQLCIIYSRGYEQCPIDSLKESKISAVKFIPINNIPYASNIFCLWGTYPFILFRVHLKLFEINCTHR